MIKERHNYSLLSHNTFGMDVKTARFIEYGTPDELCELIVNNRIKKPYLHIGQGSNLLFLKDFEGTVLHSCIKSIEITEETQECVTVKVGSGMVWDNFVAFCIGHNWYGIENLSYIPGETGASAVQNIGAYGVEAKDFICVVDTMNSQGEKRRFSVEECEYGYRYSIFKKPEMKHLFVTHVSFVLSKIPYYTLNYGTVREGISRYPVISLKAVREAIGDIRRSKLPDPKWLGNAGSFFMNPVVGYDTFATIRKEYPQMPFYEISDDRVKIPAAWLIEQCGWKGKVSGATAVYNKQPLILINRGGAKGSDILKLADAIRLSIRERFNIDIYPEVSIIG